MWLLNPQLLPRFLCSVVFRVDETPFHVFLVFLRKDDIADCLNLLQKSPFMEFGGQPRKAKCFQWVFIYVPF